MPEAIGYGASQAYQPNQANTRAGQVAEQAEAFKTKRSEAAAVIAQRQASFSTNRAEFLSRQAEQLEDRAETRRLEDGVGLQVNILA
ncbi:hypothetical protein FIU93_06235 [Labrenzia sp. THAF35]|uniref:hypothetical protein n=1 Tax=Labrenzia sp. THAF35 TaxID=2587854 RepID=UPI001267B84B|nr:hypothetical protein [Labrenzia sp. THAF35]QFT66366.1 hypothetical protein FIU93_06235 [Labrenzia sp. THAF35]